MYSKDKRTVVLNLEQLEILHNALLNVRQTCLSEEQELLIGMIQDVALADIDEEDINDFTR